MSRILPQNVEAEQALLGTIMVFPNSMESCFENSLLAEDFFDKKNQTIYENLLRLFNEQKPTDFTSLLARLNDRGLTNEIGGIDYLSELSNNAITGYSAQHYIDLIKEKSLLRQLIYASQEIIQESFENSYDSGEVLDKAERLIVDLTHSRKAGEFKTVDVVVEEVLQRIKDIRSNHGRPTGVESGYRVLDKITHGFQKGDLIIIAARPAVGKTAFALNLAVNAANVKETGPIAMFSLEMPATSLVQRMLSTKSRVEGSRLRDGIISAADNIRLNDASEALAAANIHIDDSSVIKVSEIFAKCRKLKHDKGLSLIIIDYLQLISGSKNRSESRQVEVSEISRSLKGLAREMNVPVIALSQLSRNVEKNKGYPQLSDLRESGSIEQDADIVMFLHHDEDKDAELNMGEDTESRELVIAKHRNGKTGVIELFFEKFCNKFIEIENYLNN